MAAGWNGSGAFTRLYSWVADAAAGIDILATRMDADTNLITTTGLGNCLTRDGQGIATANLPMGGFRHTGAGVAVGSGDYVTLGQVTGTTLALQGASLNLSGNATIGGNEAVTGNATVGGTLGVTGASTFTSGSFSTTLGVTGASNFTSGAFSTTLTVTGAASMGSTLSVTGAVSLTASMVISGGSTAPVANAGVLSQFSTTFANSATVTYGLVAVNSIIGFQFWASSDARLKTDIEEIPHEAAFDWISRGRPVTYKKNGSAEAGFLAQDELRSGRGASISMVEDDTMTETDEWSPAGVRLVKNYEHEIAYLTAAVQGLMARVKQLESGR